MKIAIFIQNDSEGPVLFVRFLSKVRPFQVRVNPSGTSSTLVLGSNGIYTADRYKRDGWTVMEL